MSSSSRKRTNFETRKEAQTAIRAIRMSPRVMLNDRIARFVFSTASVVAISGVSNPKKFSSRPNQNKTPKTRAVDTSGAESSGDVD